MKKINGGNLLKLDTRSDAEKSIEQFYNLLPDTLKYLPGQAKCLKQKYDALVAEGFTDQQALEIVKTRPLFE